MDNVFNRELALKGADMDELDYCYECTGYGDDYYVDDDGELICRCPECPFNPFRDDEWDD